MVYSSPTLPFMLYSQAALSALLFTGQGSSLRGTSSIQWETCGHSVVNDTSLTCGFLNVPLDYHDLTAGTARLAVIKANATRERRGTVFFNPGGPGGSGLSFLNENKELLWKYTGGVYDIVGWDPRGVGNLTIPGEVFCFDNMNEHDTFFESTIELIGIAEIGNFNNASDVETLLDQALTMQKKYEELGRRCLESPSGKQLRYIGTAATVRDMVSIANALDGPDEPVNYFGISYGTLIGSWFVNMFPERVGRVVFDGVIDPVFFATHETSTNFWHSLVSADTIYKALITGCALAGPTGCTVASKGDGPLDIDAKFQKLLKDAYDAAKANTSASPTSGQIRVQLYNEMFLPSDWSHFMNVVYPDLVHQTNGDMQSNGSDAINQQLTNREALRKRVVNDSPSYSGTAVFCADSPDVQGTTMEEVFEAIITGTQNISHLFGSIWPWPLYQCSFWPVRSVERYSGPFNKTLANKILIASNTFDPITPLPGAQVVAGLFGENAVLVQMNGLGHTTLIEPSKCLDEVIRAYMVNGTLPANNTVCDVDADFEIFNGVNTARILANLPERDG